VTVPPSKFREPFVSEKSSITRPHTFGPYPPHVRGAVQVPQFSVPPHPSDVVPQSNPSVAHVAQPSQWPVVQELLEQSVGAPHVLPGPHFAQDPPQSMSASLPLRTLSLQVAVWQMPPVHTPVVQSPAAPHFLPSPHFRVAAQDPPQSVSLSVPFFTPSEQLGAEQAWFVHTPLVQSRGAAHPSPGWQREQLVAPPQSTPVSKPFFTRSLQLGALHLPEVHTPLLQSVGATQA
jgi:hypothetical protein